MNANYISTESLYDSGAHLSHARTYSHKYIKREPDGHGGWTYTYPTMAYDKGRDVTSVRESNGYRITSTQRVPASTRVAYHRGSDPHGYGTASKAEAKRYRQADKAHDIYMEGIGGNQKTPTNVYPGEKTGGSMSVPETSGNRTNKGIQESIRSAADNAKNVATTTINDITSTAKKTYDAGISFLKNLFSQPIITTEKKWYINDKLVQQETTSGRRKSSK